MRVRLRPEIVARLVPALRRAAAREIGGILAGEHMGHNAFDIVDASIQEGGGTASFVRSATAHQHFMEGFRRRYAHDHGRFNYLGEWHSHPSFSTEPSNVDVRAMQELIEDPDQVALFAVLLIVRLGRDGRLLASATVHRPRMAHSLVELLIDDPTIAAGSGCVQKPWTRFRAWLAKRH